MENFLLTCVVGLCCGLLFLKFKIPGGMMVGSIVGVSTLTIVFHASYMPYAAKLAAQITAGAFIGCSVEKSDFVRMKSIYKPGLVLLSMMLCVNVCLGLIIYWIGPMDLLTSLLCAVPGGTSEMPLIAVDMGADAPKVLVLQFFRMAAGVGVFPSVIAWRARRLEKRLAPAVIDGVSEPDAAGTESRLQDLPPEKAPPIPFRWNFFLLTALIAALSGLGGYVLKMPAGALLCAMFGIIAAKLSGIPVSMPKQVRRGAQVLAGAYIGSSVSYQDLAELNHLIVPALILILGYFANSWFTGRLLSRRFHLNIKEGMLVATPAGASDMALISADIGVQSTDVIVLQVIRMLTAVSVFPQIMRAIAMLAGE